MSETSLKKSQEKGRGGSQTLQKTFLNYLWLLI